MRNKKLRRNDDGIRPRDGIRRPLSPRHAPSPSSYDRPPPRSDAWRPRIGERDDRNGRYSQRNNDHRSLDSYRPPVPQGDFTFRFNKPAGILDLPPSGHQYENRGPRRDRRGPPRKPGRRWQPPPNPSERALISGATLNLPEERVNDGSGGAKFRDLDEISDDDVLEMEISSPSDSEEPSRKRARMDQTSEDANSVPKWTNPDPYTVMPCPDESVRKKRDVVKLIRKARVETTAKTDAPTEAEDFLSFDMSEEEEDDDNDNVAKIPPPPSELPPPLPTSVPASFTHKHPDDRNKRNGLSSPLGSQKRTADDEIKPPDYGQLKKANMKPSRGSVTPTWLPKKNEDPCPWRTQDHSHTHNMALRLHKEIIDFYDYVRPRAFEQRIRDNLVENLRQAMRRDVRNFASAQVHPFGSFMSGLYLPTADMDLVVCSASYMRGGPPTYLGAKSWLYKFQKFLVMQKVADGDSIEVIAHARIPLVKFVDKLTGLKVDVSFENLGGITAIDTFLSWKKQYPAMPILVTVIKHFLLMRGLNEPVNGGIGGFSVICLVVSMLQMMPHVQSRSLIPEHHLGEMLLEFFELYGRQFEYEINAISLTKPIGYIRKSKVASFTYKSRDRLSIIDPNNSSNDISGGSSNTYSIMVRFGDAYFTLRDRMKEVALHPERGGILDAILKGDYSSFRLQREYLRHVHEQNIGPCSD